MADTERAKQKIQRSLELIENAGRTITYNLAILKTHDQANPEYLDEIDSKLTEHFGTIMGMVDLLRPVELSNPVALHQVTTDNTGDGDDTENDDDTGDGDGTDKSAQSRAKQPGRAKHRKGR